MARKGPKVTPHHPPGEDPKDRLGTLGVLLLPYSKIRVLISKSKKKKKREGADERTRESHQCCTLSVLLPLPIPLVLGLYSERPSTKMKRIGLHS